MSVGAQTASWEIAIDNVTADNAVVAVLGVHNATTGQDLSVRYLRRSEFLSANTYQTLTIPFTMPSSQAGNQIELRVWWADASYMRVRTTTVRGATESYRYDPNGIRVASATPPPPARIMGSGRSGSTASGAARTTCLVARSWRSATPPAAS